MDFRLSDEQELLRKSVREFAETEMRPHIMAWVYGRCNFIGEREKRTVSYISESRS